MSEFLKNIELRDKGLKPLEESEKRDALYINMPRRVSPLVTQEEMSARIQQLSHEADNDNQSYSQLDSLRLPHRSYTRTWSVEQPSFELTPAESMVSAIIELKSMQPPHVVPLSEEEIAKLKAERKFDEDAYNKFLNTDPEVLLSNSIMASINNTKKRSPDLFVDDTRSPAKLLSDVKYKLALQKEGARKGQLSNDLVSHYFEGPETAQTYDNPDSYDYQEIKNVYGLNLAELPKQQRDLAFKRSILDDLIRESGDLELLQNWNRDLQQIENPTSEFYDSYLVKFNAKHPAVFKEFLPEFERVKIKEFQNNIKNAEHKLQTLAFNQSTQQFNAASAQQQKLALDEFKKYLRQVDPVFRKFENSKYINWSEEEYTNMMLRAQSISYISGEEAAYNYLKNLANNEVASNTSGWENTCAAFQTAIMKPIVGSTSIGKYILASIVAPVSNYTFDEVVSSVERGAAMMEYANSANPFALEEIYNTWNRGDAPMNAYYTDSSTKGEFWSTNTLYDLIGQTGYLIDFAGKGKIITKVTGGLAKVATKGAAKTMKAVGAINKANQLQKYRTIAKTAQKGTSILNHLWMAHEGAALESQMVFNDYVHEQHLKFRQDARQDFEDKLAQDIQQNPGKYANLYFNETGIPLGHMPMNQVSMQPEIKTTSREYSSEDLRRLFMHFSQKEEDFQAYVDLDKKADYAQHMRQAEEAAEVGSTVTYTLNFMPNLALNATFRKAWLPKQFNVLSKSNKSLNQKVKTVFENNKWVGKAVDATKAGQFKERLGEIFSEGVQEIWEEGSSQAGLATASNVFSQIANEKYSNYGANSVFHYDVAEAIYEGLKVIPESLTSKEAMTSGIMGALAAALNPLGLSRNRNLEWSKRKEGESWINYAQRLNPVSWNSIFTTPFSNSSLKEENRQRQQLADYVTMIMQDPAKQKLYENAGYMTSIMNKLKVATEIGDQKAADDASFEIAEAAVASLSMIQDSEYYNTIVALIENRTKLDPTKLADPNSEESRAVQEYYDEIDAQKDKAPEEVLQEIVNSAKEFKALMEKSAQEYRDVLNTYGNELDPTFAEAIVKNRLTADDRQKRISALDKVINEKLQNVPYKGTPRSRLSEASQEFATQYGTGYSRGKDGVKIYEVDKALSDLKADAAKKLAEIESNKAYSDRQKKKLSKIVNKEVEKAESEIAKYKEELENLADNEKVFSAEEIVGMNPVHAAMLLRREDHSRQQQQEINKLAKIKQELILRGDLQADLDRALKADAELALNPQYLEQQYARVSNKARQAIVKSKYAYLAEPDLSYEDFRQKYFEAYNAIESESELSALLSIIEDSPHSERLTAEREVFHKTYDQVHDSERYQQLSSKSDKTEVTHLNALLYYLEEKGLGIDFSDDIDTILSKINQIEPSEFKKFVERQANGINIGTLDNEQLAQLLKSTYNSVNKDLEDIKQRNQEHVNISSENVDNNPDTSVQEKPDAVDPGLTASNETPMQEVSIGFAFNHENTEQSLQSDSGNTTTTDENEDASDTSNQTTTDKTEEETAEPEESTEKTVQEATLDELSAAVKTYEKENGLQKHQQVRAGDLKKVYTWFKNILVEGKYKKSSDETPWGYLQMRASAVSNKVLRAAIDKVMIDIESSFAIKKTQSEPVESAPLDITIEGHTGKTKEYMQKHRSYERLATTSSTRGSTVRFYTPQELIEDGQPTPVVAVVEDPKGHITIDGKKYGAVGTVPMTPTMQRENPKGKGNFVYSQRSIIDSFEKEAFQPEHYERNTPVVTTMANTDSSILTAERAAKDFAQKVQIKDGKMIYPIPRGRMDTTVDAEVYVGKPRDVKSDGQHTIFDKAEEYNKISTDEQATEEQKDNAASSLLRYNGFVKKAAQALGRNFGNQNGTVGLQKVVETLVQDPTADVGAAMSEMWKKVNSSLEFSGKDHYTMVVKNVSKNEDGSVSFDVALASLWETIPLTSITNAKADQKLSDQHYADILLNLMYTPAKAGETERQLRYKNGKETKGSWMQYNVMYKNAQGEKITANIKEAALAGVLISNHKDFKSRPAGLRVSLLRDNTPFTDDKGVSDMTDNAAPATPPSDITTTTDGIKVDTDTGLAAEAASEPVQETEEVSAETTAEEIVEEAAQNIEDTYDEDFEMPDYENIPDDTDDMDEDYEYQIIKARKTLISRVKDYFSALIHSLEGEQAYTEIVAETKQQFQQDTKTNAFTFTTAREKKEARKNAEARAKAIRNMDLPHVKSVSVVSNGNRGYSISISYHDYSRYIRRRVAEVESMSTTALRETAAAFSDTKKALHPTQQEAENSKSFFSQFGNKSLKEQFQKKISEPISQKLDNLLTEILSSYNIKVIEKDLKAIYGNDIAGAINSAGDIIYLAKGGSRNSVTLAEETAHALIRNIANGKHVDEDTKALYDNIAAGIESTSLYKETLDEYKNVYINEDTNEPDYDRIKQEAIGKALAVALSNKYSTDNTLKAAISDLANTIILKVKSLLEKSGLTNGKEAVLQYKLKQLATKLLEEDVKKVNKKNGDTLISSVLSSLGIDTKSKHKKSKKELQMEKDKKRIVERSSARTILYENLTEETKEIMSKKGITETSWKEFPMELQEQILKCLSKN